MITPISRLTGTLYKHAFKPLMFRFSTPDDAHSRIIKVGSLWQKIPLTDKLIHAVWGYNHPKLTQTIHGITYHNAVGLSAGFDKNIELLPVLKSVGFGFMTGGSVTFEQCEGNPRPWFYRLPHSKSLVVHVGLANQGATRIYKRLQHYPSWRKNKFPLTISVAKTNSPGTCTDSDAIADYTGTFKLMRDDPRIASFELNISCPNTYGGEPFTTPKRLEALLAAVDALKLKQPVVIKMPVDLRWRDFNALLAVIITHKIAGVTIANLRKDRGGVDSKDTLPKHVRGNLSGRPTQALSDELIRKTYAHYGDKLTIIGVGGIFSAEDAYRKITLGASMVALVTSLIYEGPQIVGQINKELVALLERDGFTHISEAIGSANK